MTTIFRLTVLAIGVSMPLSGFAQDSLVQARGAVEIQSSRTQALRFIRAVPLRLRYRDMVETGSDGMAILRFEDLSEVRLDHNSSFILQKETRTRMFLSLSFGRLSADVSESSSRIFTVSTPAAVVSVQGGRFSVDSKGTLRTVVEAREGSVTVRGRRYGKLAGKAVVLHPGQRLSVTKGRVGPLETIKRGLELAQGYSPKTDFMLPGF